MVGEKGRKIEFEPVVKEGKKAYKMLVPKELVDAIKRVGERFELEDKYIYIKWLGAKDDVAVYDVYSYSEAWGRFRDVEESDIEKYVEAIREANEELQDRKKLVFYL